MIESFDNIGVAVTDYPRAVDFYKKLGFELDFEEGEGGSLKAGNAVLYVFKTTSGTSPQSRDVTLTGNPPGIDHISFRDARRRRRTRTLTQGRPGGRDRARRPVMGLAHDHDPRPGWQPALVPRPAQGQIAKEG